MENHHACKFGKPSISIGAIYTMAMLVITRGYIDYYIILHINTIAMFEKLPRKSTLQVTKSVETTSSSVQSWLENCLVEINR